MHSKQIRELLSDALAELSAEGVAFYFFANGDDKSVVMVSPGLARLCKTMDLGEVDEVENLLRK